MENFLGKDGFVWWTGVIEDRHDPLNLGRCRVRIFGWHNEDKMLMPTDTLPWAMPKLPVNNSKTFTTPVEGDWVTGYFFDSHAAQFPVYDGVLPGIARSLGNPQKGFSDPRTDDQLMTSPALPANNTVAVDGSGTETKNKPAARNPADVGFPSINKLAINDLTNQAPQIVERTANTVKNIIGPVAKTLGTEIAGAAQGAAQALQGIVPQLDSLVPKVDDLVNSIKPSLNDLSASLGSSVSSLTSSLSSAASGLTSGLSGAQSALTSQLAEAQKNLAGAQASVTSQLASAQTAATDALNKAQASLQKDLPTLQAEAKNVAGMISGILNGLSAGSLSTKTPVVLVSEMPKADLGAVVSAPLVNTLAPNNIPNEVPLEKAASTQQKSLENSISLYKDYVKESSKEKLDKISKITSRLEATQTLNYGSSIDTKRTSLVSEILSSTSPSKGASIVDSLNAYKQTYSDIEFNAFRQKIAELKASPGGFQ